jgi:hypothetical protein
MLPLFVCACLCVCLPACFAQLVNVIHCDLVCIGSVPTVGFFLDNFVNSPTIVRDNSLTVVRDLSSRTTGTVSKVLEKFLTSGVSRGEPQVSTPVLRGYRGST